MDMTLEVLLLPVSDVDRSLAFYRDKVGFNVDVDTEPLPGARVVQLTPPGSGCSVALTVGLPNPTGTPQPGSYHGLQLVVADIKAAREELTSRGLNVSEPEEYVPDDGGTFMYFTDPDGNGWAVQEFRKRAVTPLHRQLSEEQAD